MPGRGHSASWWRGYHKVKKSGKSKASAAKIMNAAKSKASRKRKRKK